MVAYQMTRKYSPEVQIIAMRSRYPQFKYVRGEHGCIVFKGKLRVKAELPEYEVKILYCGDKAPKIYILSPELVDGAPHIYSNTKSLCLYHPNNYKWHSGKLIAEDIMGWTAGWIYFYEYWLQIGEWIGPEAPHNI
jgi:hypothetical protein